MNRRDFLRTNIAIGASLVIPNIAYAVENTKFEDIITLSFEFNYIAQDDPDTEYYLFNNYGTEDAYLVKDIFGREIQGSLNGRERMIVQVPKQYEEVGFVVMGLHTAQYWRHIFNITTDETIYVNPPKEMSYYG